VRVNILNAEGTFDEPRLVSCGKYATLTDLKEEILKSLGLPVEGSLRLIKALTYATAPPDKLIWPGRTMVGEIRTYHRIYDGTNLYAEVYEDEQTTSQLIAAYEIVRNYITVKYNHPDTSKMHVLKIDKRKTVAELREEIAKTLQMDASTFKMKDTTKELVDDDKALNAHGVYIVDNSTLSIERGTPGACKVEFSLCDADDMFKFTPLFEMQVSQHDVIADVKAKVAAKMQETGKSSSLIDPSRMRLRDRALDYPGKIFQDGALKDALAYSWRDDVKVAVEVMSEPEQLKVDELMLRIQLWQPSEFSVGPKQEVAVPEKASLVEMENFFSRAVGIPQSDLEVVHCYMYNGLDILDVPNEKWESLAEKEAATKANSNRGYPYNYSYTYEQSVGGLPWHCKDGQLFLVKDKTQPTKELSGEEKKKLEDVKVYAGRNSTYSSSYGYGYRRAEQGVKIDGSKSKRRPSVED